MATAQEIFAKHGVKYQPSESSPDSKAIFAKYGVRHPEEKNTDYDALSTYGAQAGNLFGVGPKVAGAIETAKGFIKHPSSWEEVKNKFTENTDLAEQAYKEASEQNPKSALAGKIASIAASSQLPLGNVAKEASLTQKALSGAKIGAAYGIGSSRPDKEEIEDIGLNTLKSAAIGGAGASVIPAIASGKGLLEKGWEGAATLAEKLPEIEREAGKAIDYGSISRAIYRLDPKALIPIVARKIAGPYAVKAGQKGLNLASKGLLELSEKYPELKEPEVLQELVKKGLIPMGLLKENEK